MSEELEFIIEPQREIPVLDKADVVVVGGGPSGIAAAVASARAGARTILVERYGCLGGNITVVGVEPVNWYRQPMTADAGGIGMEYDIRMGGVYKAVSRAPQMPTIGYAYNTEFFKAIADEMIEEAGVIPYLHCLGAMPYMEGNTIKGVITESKSGRQAILASRVIDCTGDADIASRAGVPFEKGGPNGEFMGATMIFSMNGVDIGKLERFMEQNPVFNSSRDLGAVITPFPPFVKARDNGEWPADYNNKFQYFTMTEYNEARGINHASMRGIDGTNVKDLTRAEMHLRKHVLDSIKVLRRYMDGFQQSDLRNFGMSVGIRETRRITGEYRLTFQDIVDQAEFEDSIGIFPVYMDALDVYPKVIFPDNGDCFQIPYRCILPVEVENLLVGGRSVSADRACIGTLRQMSCCAVTGQAAGVAAAVSVATDTTPRQVDRKLVQKELRRQGVRLQ